MRIEPIGRRASATGGSIVLLPGVGQRLEDFVRHGFDAALHERRLPLDLLLASPALAHLTDRDWLPRLRAELAALRAGGRPLWLGGISLGAYMALRYAAEFPDAFDGLCLLAPYLGSRIIAAEVARARPLHAWRAGALTAEDDERRIWRYVLGLRAPAPRVFIGLGAQDRFADTQRLLLRALPHAGVVQLEGGHDWPVWRQLWENFLDRHLGEPEARPVSP